MELGRPILELVPAAQECISYGMPAYKLGGRAIAGFAAFKNHLSYLPHSGSVLPALGEDLRSYSMTKGALHFAIEKPLPKNLVKKLIAIRLREVQTRPRGNKPARNDNIVS